jgi:hypothetical protein
MKLNKLQEALPAAVKKKIGKILFGDNYATNIADKQVGNLKKLQGLPKSVTNEPNTKWEFDLLKDIEDWVERPDNKIAADFIKSRSDLSALAKEYPELIQAPVGKKAYRGSKIKAKSIVKTLKAATDIKSVYLKSNQVIKFTNFPYFPLRNAQSWTTNIEVALEFAYNGYGYNNVRVVYQTVVDDKNWLFNPKLMNIVFSADGGGKEDETIRVAGAGTFTAYILTDSLILTKVLHFIPSAKPFFAEALVKYNKQNPKKQFKKWPDASDTVAWSTGTLKKVKKGESLQLAYHFAAQEFLDSIK